MDILAILKTDAEDDFTYYSTSIGKHAKVLIMISKSALFLAIPAALALDNGFGKTPVSRRSPKTSTVANINTRSSASTLTTMLHARRISPMFQLQWMLSRQRDCLPRDTSTSKSIAAGKVMSVRRMDPLHTMLRYSRTESLP